MRVIFCIFLTCFFAFAQDVSGVSIQRMIGQMIVMNFGGTRPDDQWVNQLAKEISYGKIGGVVITDNNIINKNQLKKLTKRFNDIATGHKLFIATFQNGTTNKINSGEFEKFLPPSEISQNLDIFLAKEHYQNMANSLLELGINLNLAPNISKFPFDSDVEINTIYTDEFLSVFSSKILSVLGEFPNKNGSNFDINNLKIFYDLIRRGRVFGIMLSDEIVPELDDKPAMYSQKIGEILRQRFKFQGVIFSQGLFENNKLNLEDRVALAINSGVDVFILSTYFWNNTNSVKSVTEAILSAIEKGKITKEQVENSYKRIVKFKENL